MAVRSGSIGLRIVATAVVLMVVVMLVWALDLWSGIEPEDTASQETGPPEIVVSETKMGTTSDPVGQATGSPDGWIIVALVMMAFATLVSVATTLYLYRWRRILLSDPKMLVPEELGQYLCGLGKNISQLTKVMHHDVKLINHTASKNSQQVSRMIETYMTLQNALDERDAEIHRFKKGYDAEVFRKFLNRLIRVDQTVDEFIQEQTADPEHMKLIKRLLEDALDECGVEVFRPTLGADYRTEPGVADNPKIFEAKRSEDNFMIAEILGVGYRLRVADEHNIVVPARVAIFEYDK